MRGFLKRDWALLCINLRFYLFILLVLGAVCIFAKSGTVFGVIGLQAMVMAFASVVSLFSYDEANHWQSYAAAAPRGRESMVDARYVLAACLGLTLMALTHLP